MGMPRYIDPFTDFGFKRIFGSTENKRFLISFLNDLLDIEHQIIDLEYRNLEQLGLNIIDRKAVFDVYCTDETGNNFIVELQRSQQKYFKDRSVYYTAFPIQEQSKKGDWDYYLKKVFFVGILDFSIDDIQNHYLTKVQLKDEKNQVFYDKLTYYYIQIPHFKKQAAELSSHLEYWLYYLQHLAESEAIPNILQEDHILKDAFDVAEFIALSKDEQFAYQLDVKARLDYQNVMNYAKERAAAEGMAEGMAEGLAQGLEKGLAQGLETGLAQGLEKGLAQGLEKGLEKGLAQGLEKGMEQGIDQGRKKEKMAIAMNLLDILDEETIASKTGLSVEEIKQLKAQAST